MLLLKQVCLANILVKQILNSLQSIHFRKLLSRLNSTRHQQIVTRLKLLSRFSSLFSLCDKLVLVLLLETLLHKDGLLHKFGVIVSRGQTLVVKCVLFSQKLIHLRSEFNLLQGCVMIAHLFFFFPTFCVVVFMPRTWTNRERFAKVGRSSKTCSLNFTILALCSYFSTFDCFSVTIKFGIRIWVARKFVRTQIVRLLGRGKCASLLSQHFAKFISNLAHLVKIFAAHFRWSPLKHLPWLMYQIFTL